MSKAEHRVGISAVLKRHAFHYLQRGLGTYPSEHAPYVKVIVRSLYDWSTPTDDNVPSQGAIVVEFWSETKRERWVEFGCRVVGGGGDPIVREV